MANAQNNSPLIGSKADLIQALEKGCKPKSDWRIGTEHEKFVFCKTSHKPVPYEGETGIGAILTEIQRRTDWTPAFGQRQNYWS